MLHACEVWLPTERLTKHLCETEPQNPPAYDCEGCGWDHLSKVKPEFSNSCVMLCLYVFLLVFQWSPVCILCILCILCIWILFSRTSLASTWADCTATISEVPTPSKKLPLLSTNCPSVDLLWGCGCGPWDTLTLNCKLVNDEKTPDGRSWEDFKESWFAEFLVCVSMWFLSPFLRKLVRLQWSKKKDLPVLRSKDPTTQDRPTTAMCCHAHATWFRSLKVLISFFWDWSFI